MAATVEVRFKGIRKSYYRWADAERPPRLQDPVIVETDRGFDFGHVSAVGETAERKCASCAGCAVGEPAPDAATLPSIIRRATDQDQRQASDLRRGEDDVRRRVAERARSHGLEMKIADTEWQWDRKKLTVYFTAEQRVDFRGLVRELAAQYHTRIDLRQIGARDEAARLGGVGRCGREYCCSTWLTELSPVSLSLAKDQHLSLNPTQISGGCGRLLCCLKYEHEFYLSQRKRFPKEGKTLRTLRGPERVVAVDIFRERVALRSEEHGPRTLALADLHAELDQSGEAMPVPADRPARPERSRARPGDRSRERPAAATAGPPPSPAPAETPEPGAEASPARRRRRRRRRRKPGKPDDGPGPDGNA